MTESTKITCSACGAMYLPMTFDKTGGLCMPCFKSGIDAKNRHLFAVFAYIYGVVYFSLGTLVLTRIEGFGFSQITLFISAILSVSTVGILTSLHWKSMWYRRAYANPEAFGKRKTAYFLYKLGFVSALLVLSGGASVVLFKFFPTIASLPNVATVFLGIFGSFVAAITVWRSL